MANFGNQLILLFQIDYKSFIIEEYLKKVLVSARGPEIFNSLTGQARNSDSLSMFNSNIPRVSLINN